MYYLILNLDNNSSEILMCLRGVSNISFPGNINAKILIHHKMTYLFHFNNFHCYVVILQTRYLLIFSLLFISKHFEFDFEFQNYTIYSSFSPSTYQTLIWHQWYTPTYIFYKKILHNFQFILHHFVAAKYRRL